MAWFDPRTWLAGEDPTAAIFNQQIRDNFKAIGDPWTPYTPVWTGTTTNPALGNGTITGSYMLAGKYCVGRARITTGTGTTYGSGFWNITLPFPLASGLQWESVGSCSVRSAAGTSYGLDAMSVSASAISAATNAGGRLSPTVPFSVTASSVNIISFDFVYEAA